MKRDPVPRHLVIVIVMVIVMVGISGSAPAAGFSFKTTYVDTSYGGNGKPGWARAGDMDGDGDLDIVAGGGNALFIYENDGAASGWVRHGSLDGAHKVGANGAVLHDADGDGDLDVISAKYNSELGWWENPGGKLKTTTWTFHVVASASWFLHDMIRVDLDKDGVSDELVANLISGSQLKVVWLEAPTDPTKPWTSHTIEPGRGDGNTNHSGIDVGDIDKDGDADLAYSNGWYEAPGDPTQGWTWHKVTDVAGLSNTLVRDMDGDGDQDLITAAGHHSKGVYWFENTGNPKTGTWTKHDIAAELQNPECLAALDLDGDKDLDLVTCDLDFAKWDQKVHNVYVLENLSKGQSWNKVTIVSNTYANHQLQTVDINEDGKQDIISEGCGYSIISYHENGTGVPGVPGFAFKLEVVESSYPGNGKPGWSAAGDLDGDGDVDVVAGGGGALQWYEAPSWARHPVEQPTTTGGNGGQLLDVDRDGDLDIVAALYNSDLAWWENPGGQGTKSTWTRHSIDAAISNFNHDLVSGDLDGDKENELVALYVGGGVFWYDIPAKPATDPWPRTQILASIQDPFVGLALGDLDGDNDLDVVVSNKWYQQPAQATTPDWQGTTLFAAAVQNVFCADVNRDGRLDVVGAEGFKHPDGRVLWAEAPQSPTGAWTEHLVADGLDGPENIWAGDLNDDGKVDIVTAEMGTSTGFNDSDSTFIVLEGLDPAGTSWKQHLIEKDVGVSARIMPVDLDGDGDIDFTADGNAENHIYVWWNETSTAQPTSDGGTSSTDGGSGGDASVSGDGTGGEGGDDGCGCRLGAQQARDGDHTLFAWLLLAICLALAFTFTRRGG